MMIYGLQSTATVRGSACRWQENPEPLRECQIVFGCVDSYQDGTNRSGMQAILMHYIDVGMDVHGRKHRSSAVR